MTTSTPGDNNRDGRLAADLAWAMIPPKEASAPRCAWTAGLLGSHTTRLIVNVIQCRPAPICFNIVTSRHRRSSS